MSFKATYTNCCRILAGLMVVLTPTFLLGGAPAPRKQQAKYEVQFLTGMIDHHHMAVMMAELCLDRAVHEELEQLCEQIRTSQSEEIEMMQEWLADWYGVVHEPRMKRGDQKMMDRMAEMTGEEFEIEFMEMMIRHHAKAVQEGMKCTRRAYHADLIEMCESIVETQMQEIETMEGWLCQWYGMCE